MKNKDGEVEESHPERRLLDDVEVKAEDLGF